MSLSNKKFTEITTGRVVEVKDSFEDIAILTDNSKVRVTRLLDRNFYEEYIDPKSFFNNQSLLNDFASKIKQLPDSVVQNIREDVSTTTNTAFNPNNIPGSTSIKPAFNDSAVLLSDPELEKEELMRKYNIQNNAQSAAQSQLERFKGLLDEPGVVLDGQEQVQRIDVNRNEEGEVVRVDIDRESGEVSINNVEQVPTTKSYNKPQPQQEDPIIIMFKNVKRNTDLKFTLKIENKIPRPDFIEMMEDSYNVSIIDFLAQEFTNSLINDPDSIKELIKSEINKIVYKEKDKKEVNSQITDSVTEKNNEAPENKESKTTIKKKSVAKKPTIKND